MLDVFVGVLIIALLYDHLKLRSFVRGLRDQASAQQTSARDRDLAKALMKNIKEAERRGSFLHSMTAAKDPVRVHE